MFKDGIKIANVMHTVCLLGSGDKNISILHLSCRMSDLQFSLVLQTHALVLLKLMQ